MGINIGNKKVKALYANGKPVRQIYNGFTKVYDLFKDFTLNAAGTEITGYVGSGGSVAIPYSTKVTSIAAEAFKNKTSITSISIPSSITSIGQGAFTNCSNMNSVYFSTTNLTALPTNCFANCTSLSYISWPSNLQTIGSNCFLNTGFYRIDSMPNTVTFIGGTAFTACHNLTNVRIPNSVQTIGARIFAECESLEEIIIPFIGPSAPTMVVGSSDKVLGWLFNNNAMSASTYYAADQYYTTSDYVRYYLPKSLTKVEVTNQQYIPYGTFYNCQYLENLELGNWEQRQGLSIFTKAAYNCIRLTQVTLTGTAISIGSYAFSECGKDPDMSDPTLGIDLNADSVSISSYAFYNTQIGAFQAEDVSTMVNLNNTNAFEPFSMYNADFDKIVAWVPNSLKNQYQLDAKWSSIESESLVDETPNKFVWFFGRS